LLFPDVFAGSERLDRSSVHVKKGTVSDRQVSSVKETSLWAACLATLFNVSRLSRLCIKSHPPQDSDLYRAAGMAPQIAAPPGVFVRLAILKKSTDALFRTVMAVVRFLFHYSRLLRYVFK
jgi:hypothetical protein